MTRNFLLFGREYFSLDFGTKTHILTNFKDIYNNGPGSLPHQQLSFSSTFLPLHPRHGRALKENKPLKLINIPAYRLAGGPPVW